MKRLLLLLCLLPILLHADEPHVFDYTYFARIPILHEGRIKPLESFARVALKKIHGEPSFEGSPAIAWLAHTLFAPQETMQQRLFTVRSAALLQTLGLPERTSGLYNFHELAAAFASHASLITALTEKDRKTLTPTEQELATLYVSVNDLAEIAGSFSLLLPLPEVDETTRKALSLPAHADITYLDVLKIKEKMTAMVKDTVRRKQDNIAQYTASEQEIAALSYRTNLIEAMDKSNALLRVIPPFWEGSEEWVAPWTVIEKGAGSPGSVTLFRNWQALAASYRDNDSAAWNQASAQLLADAEHSAGVRPFALSLEVKYHTFDLLNKSLMGYIFGLALILFGALRRFPKAIVAAYVVMLISAALHGVAIAMRMFILMRPPVGTLYESMIFVSFVSAAFSLWLERHKRSADGLLIGSIIATLLLLAADVFAADSDTLEVLVAVLNTNFWLATHVVCITTGYGLSLVAGTMAHLWLFKRCRAKDTGTLAPLYRRMHSVALAALLFTAVGTMLGGIWADQSWGRFWGWDPKENGALWIVLWLIWLLHGRMAGQLRELGFAVNLAFVNIVVALAWVGVNLLSVGLHSYGFTDTAANSLLAFCATEIGFISVTACIIAYGQSEASKRRLRLQP